MKWIKITALSLTLILAFNPSVKAGFHCDEWSKDKETCLKCNGIPRDKWKGCFDKCVYAVCESSALQSCIDYCAFKEANN